MNARATDNLAHILVASAQKAPGDPAIKLDDFVLDYGTLEELSRHTAGLLASKGVQPGDRVAIILPNIPQMPCIYYGILRLGAVVVPLNPLLKAPEIEYYLQDSGARLLLAWEGAADEARKAAAGVGVELVRVDAGAYREAVLASPAPAAVAAVGPEDVAVLLYTSGTTGRPKGAALTHFNLLDNARISVELFSTGPGDVVFGGLPFFHVFGQTCALNSVILAGATVTLLPRFDPARALEIIERDRVSIFEGVPTMYIGLLRCPERPNHDYSSLRVACTGGSAMPVEVLHEFEDFFKADLLEGYGLSETSPVVTFNQIGQVRKPGSVGTPVRGVQVRVIDDAGRDVPAGEVGELAVRGPVVMKEYWHNPEATAAAAIVDGWFHTGDLGRIDGDGAIFIVDRKKDLILRSGYNVYPREVEEVLYAHPAVAEAAVIGEPEPVHGEQIVAVVVLKDGAQPEGPAAQEALKAELMQFLRDRLAAYKCPHKVVFTHALPKGPTGKILKRELRG